MELASVILDIPTQALDDAFTYAVPDGMDEAQIGCAVSVPFGRRAAIGFVLDIREADPEAEASDLPFDPKRLKSIHQVLSQSYFNEDGAACARFLAHRYVAPLSTCIRLFTPPGGVPRMVHTGGRWKVEAPKVGEVDDRWVKLGPKADDFVPRKGAVKQAAILEALSQGELRVAELAYEYGAVGRTLKSLAAKGVVVIERRRRMRGFEERSNRSETEYRVIGQKPTLTAGQQQALGAIQVALDQHDGHVVVVDGVTGSGKTEIYLRAIERVLERGQRALVLVPEISLTPQTVARFRGRFGDQVAVMHSRMSQGERYDQWDFIRSGRARVVVGARSALFTPLDNLGIIVIDEEHESSYKQDQAPRYQSRDVAYWMAKRSGAALVLGSATPSIEALHACKSNPDWKRIVLPERANGKPLPAIEVVDMSAEFRSGSRSMFSAKLAHAIEDTMRRGEKAILLLNQRGFAKFLLCRDCGFVPECPNCSTSLTFHEKGALLMCHHCDYREKAPARCPKCGSPYLKKFGAGTQRVEASLRGLVAGFEGVECDIIRMDADTTKTKGAHRKLLERFMSDEAAILLGTQMIAKGLDFADVTLVGVINADTTLKLPDFRSGERTFDLIEQVAGRAGRAELPGRVIVQTYQPDAVPIRAAANYDRQLFLSDELYKRRVLKYPPFVRIANILVWGADESVVRTEALALSRQISELLRDQVGDTWLLLPATPCVLARLRSTYRWHLTIKCPPDDDPARILQPFFKKRKAKDGVSVAVDIDPMSLL
ncbi:MAG: replication restart helicase PriA [Eggerthellaceae bacterium]